jgi:hypothetical protein
MYSAVAPLFVGAFYGIVVNGFVGFCASWLDIAEDPGKRTL